MLLEKLFAEDNKDYVICCVRCRGNGMVKKTKGFKPKLVRNNDFSSF